MYSPSMILQILFHKSLMACILFLDLILERLDHFISSHIRFNLVLKQ